MMRNVVKLLFLLGTTIPSDATLIITDPGNQLIWEPFRFPSKTLRKAADELTAMLQSESNELRFESAGTNYPLVDTTVRLEGEEGNACVEKMDDSCERGFLCAFYTAYAHGLPLEIGPEDIWLFILQSIAQHFDTYQNEIRGEFRTDDEEWNSAWWPIWVGFLKDSQRAEATTLQSLREIIPINFSTINPHSTLSFQLAVSESKRENWTLREKKSSAPVISQCCNIPRITLRGSEEDYAKLSGGVDQLIGLIPSLGWYLNRVQNIVAKVEETSRGVVNATWWKQAFFSLGGCPSTPLVAFNGWVLQLLAYDYHPNRASEIWIMSTAKKSFHILLLSGFMGLGQHKETYAVRPVIGWISYYVVPKTEVYSAVGKCSKWNPSGFFINLLLFLYLWESRRIGR